MAFANNVDYAKVFQTALDLQMVQNSVTGWMDANAGQVQYNGGNEVKVPKMALTGLGDYNRATGYPEGSVSLSYETFTMTQDRGTQFLLDKMDVNETNFVMNATKVMSEFQRLHAIPEVDAYRISKLATYAITGDYAATNVTYNYTPDEDTIIGVLNDVVEEVGEDAVIMATPETIKALQNKVGANNISSDSFVSGGFNQKVPTFNDCPIIRVKKDRMVTAIQTADLVDGAGGGWSKGASALDINFIVVPRTVPIGVDKLDEPGIFDPSVVQDYSGWLINYRRYHDLWVMDNKIEGIFVNIKDEAPESN